MMSSTSPSLLVGQVVAVLVEHHVQHLARVQLEASAHAAFVHAEPDRRGKAQARRTRRREHRLAVADLHLRLLARIVQARLAIEVEAHAAAQHAHPAQQARRAMAELFRAAHQVGDLGADFVAHPVGEQDIGVRHIGLDHARVLDLGRQREVAAPFGVEQGGEHARAVEVGPAQEIDRAVIGHQRHGGEVADHAVVGDGARWSRRGNGGCRGRGMLSHCFRIPDTATCRRRAAPRRRSCNRPGPRP